MEGERGAGPALSNPVLGYCGREMGGGVARVFARSCISVWMVGRQPSRVVGDHRVDAAKLQERDISVASAVSLTVL